MHRFRLLFFVVCHLALFGPHLTAQDAAGPNAEKLAQIPAAMEAEIAAHHAAGVVALVLHDGKIVHQSATGSADRERNRPMTADSVFWIASMTKSISAATILSMVDEGKLTLDEPAYRWIPELEKAALADGSALERPVTLRDLLSHTSGLAFPPRKASDGAQSLKGYVAELVKAPWTFQPGADYEYGFGITVAGRCAEIASGQSFEALVQARMLDPLGMKDTSFHPDERLRERLAKTYKTAEDGPGLVPGYNPFVTPDPTVRHMTEPSGGLFSTAMDLAAFYQMILDGGMHQGKRILSKEAIAEMTKPHEAGDQPLNYGLGWQCNLPDKPVVKGFPANSFGHGGAFGTHGWIDPDRRLIAIYLVQNVLVTGGGKTRDLFHGLVNGQP
jgi:CubicO group peptidase (beta-lactamase class C family)